MPIETIALPRVLSDVTPAWLSAMLGQAYPGTEVTDAVMDGVFGNKPNKTRIHLNYNEAGRAARLPATMVLKASLPGLGNGQSGAGLDIATAAEVLAYQQIVPTLDVESPHVFHSILDWEGGNAVLLMEDLRERGFTPLNAFTPLDYGQAAAFTEALAGIHATHWESPEFEPGGKWGPDTDVGGCSSRLYETFLEVIIGHDWWSQWAREPRAAALPRKLADGGTIQRAWKRLSAVMGGTARTIIHGDEHLGNLYLNADEKPGFLDYFARIEHWPISYAYFLSNSLDSLDRRDWERPLLARYLRQLRTRGVAAPDFDEAWYAYRCALLFPMIVWFTNPANWQPEAINTLNTARAGLAMLDHGTLDLLGI